MGKRVRITNDRVNSYGTRVLTAGVDVEQYRRNPVLLYMHERGSVIGYVKDLKVENGEITGEPVFDEASELSVRCKKQWEFGSLKMVSAGLDIVETSEVAEDVVAGQTHATITKSKLYEVSIVDIGANDDALVLRKDGEEITLGKGGTNPLPSLNNNNQKNREQMDRKVIALQLGLPETATEAEVSAKLAELKSAGERNATLLKEKEALTLASIENMVAKAIGEKRLDAGKKEQFVELGKKVGPEELGRVLEAMQPQVKLSQVINGASPQAPSGYKKLSEVPAGELLRLRKEDAAEYSRLYKAEYGMECVINK